MLGLRRGGLVASREVEAGGVQGGFQMAVCVEPGDWVGYGAAGGGAEIVRMASIG